VKGNILEVIIGGFVLIVSSFFMYFAYTSGGEQIKQGYVLTARFDDVSGIMAGSDVKLNGIKVGVVKSLVIDEDYQAKVELLFRDDIKIPKDSSANITTDGLMGSKFISISVGYSEQKLKPSEEIEITKSAINIEGLISRFVMNGFGNGSKSNAN
jgi:phospholipid/cholesterol/gamma-HCH transport system substrate-binding protein